MQYSYSFDSKCYPNGTLEKDGFRGYHAGMDLPGQMSGLTLALVSLLVRSAAASSPAKTCSPKQMSLWVYESFANDSVSTAAVHSWVNCLRSPSDNVRIDALKTLGPDSSIFHSPEARSAVRQATQDSNAEVRFLAMQNFAWFNYQYAATAHAEALKGLRDPDLRVRLLSAKTLGNIGAAARTDIRRILEPGSGVDLLLAAIAAAHAGVENNSVPRTLLAGLGNDATRPEAQVALIALGDGAAPIRNDLLRLIDDPNKDVSYAAMEVLAGTRMAPASLAPRMRELVRKDDRALAAAHVLGSIGSPAAEAIPELIATIHGPVGSCCAWYADSIVQIGTASVSALLPVSHETDPYRRAWAVYILARLAGRDPRAADRVIAALDEDSETSFRAKDGLEKAGPEIRPLARRLYGRLLKRERLWQGDEMKLLKPALPIPPDEFYPAISTSEIQVTLSGPAGAVQSTQDVSLDVAIKNLSGRPIRLLNPKCSVIMEDPGDLLIFKEPGWPLMRVSHTMTGMVMFMPTENMATKLAPGQEASFKCGLQNPEREHGGFAGWSFGYWYVGLPEKNPNRLQPGRYRIRARYRLTADEAAKTRFWSKELAERFGSLWLGEAYSNEIVLNVN